MEVIRIQTVSDAIQKEHDNRVLLEMNDSCIRLAVMQDRTYGWHSHPDSDEAFMVLEGELRIELEDGQLLSLHPGEVCTVPAGKIHRTIAVGRTVNLCFEKTAARTEFVGD